MDEVHNYNFSLEPEFEFEAMTPEQLLVRAMHSTRPIFITDSFIGKVSRTKPSEVIRQMVSDLHRDSHPDETADVLRWHYLFTDFEHDLPRLLMMSPDDD